MTAKDRAALLRLAGRAESDSLPAMTVCRLGGALQSVAEHAAAVKFLRAGRDRFPDDFWVTLALGGALRASEMMNNTIAGPGAGKFLFTNSKRADEVIGCMRTAVALRPRSGEAHLGLGITLYTTGDLTGAEAACRRVIALDLKSANGHQFLGVIYLAKSDWDRAEAAFRNGLEVDPRGILAAKLHTNIGMCRWQKRDLAGAEAAYRKAIEIDPKLLEGYLTLGPVLMMRGDSAGVVSTYRKALELSPDTASLHSLLAMALMLSGKSVEAEAEFRKVIRLDPKDVQSHIGLGELLQRRKDWGGAEAAYREAIRLDPKVARAQENLGRLLQSRGQFDAAIPLYNEALRLEPQHTALREELKKVERRGKLLPRLPEILAGTAEPKTPAETCEFADLCTHSSQKRYLDAARLFGKAFAAEPKLADDPVAQHRYNSACCAALAGRGEGLDAPSDPAKRSALRAEALAWLNADLTQYKKRAASSNAAERRVVTARLTHWLKDSDFNGTRPGLLRIGMPAVERAEWDAFWTDVKATLAEARKPAPAPRPKG